MSHISVKSTSSFLLAAGALALAGIASAADLPKGASGKALSGGDKVHCYNVNSCKGTADCKTAESACKGQNSCKGMGFKAVSVKACVDMNGTIADL